MLKKLIICVVVILFAAGLLFMNSCKGPTQPTYDSDNPDPNPSGMAAATLSTITPDNGFWKAEVTLQGTGFSTTPEFNFVAFGNKQAVIKEVTATEIKIISPFITGETVDVKVAIKGSEFWSNALQYAFKGAEEALTVIADDINWPMGIDADDNGNVYVGSATDEVIYMYDSQGTQSVFAEVPPSGSLGWGPDGYLYVAQSWENKIVRVSPDGQTVEDVIEEIDTPVDFDWDSNGIMYICCNDAGFKTYDGTDITHVADIGGGAKSCRVFEDNVYLTNIWDSQIMKFPISDAGVGEAEIIYEGDSPVGLEIDSEGTIYFSEAWETTLYTIDANGNIDALFEEQLMTPMRYFTMHGKFLYIVYPGWGDVGEIMSVYIGVEQAPNHGLE